MNSKYSIIPNWFIISHLQSLNSFDWYSQKLKYEHNKTEVLIKTFSSKLSINYFSSVVRPSAK
jgi:hypothetical protein